MASKKTSSAPPKTVRAKVKPSKTSEAAEAASSSTLVDEQLARYRSMRDFHVTAEPSGGSRAKAEGSALPFVIQKHAATRLHYDFRLGLHGVLKSWAVTKGPSYVTSDKRLAVEVEDHPMEYGGFEGTIPKGQYGGGTVMLWDEGTWEPVGDPDAGLAKGDLKFILHGKKMQGKWVLVRMGGKAAQEAKPNWLLIKEHDEYEQTAADQPVVDRLPNSVITKRDLDAIARDEDHVWQSNRPEADAPANKAAARKAAVKAAAASPVVAKPGPATAAAAAFAPGDLPGRKEDLPAFIPPQLASEATTPPVGEQWLHELKLDGYRIQAHIDKAGKVRLFTRSGLDWTHRMQAVARGLGGLSVEGAVLDGEVVVLDAKGQSNFASLQAAFENGAAHPLTYYVFDLLHLNGHDLRAEELAVRKQLLAQMLKTLPEQDVVRYSEHLESEGATILAEACRLQAEGIVSKRADSSYLSGRSKSWVKIKCYRRQEFVVGGFTKPANGSDGIGALLLGYYDGKKLIYAGRAGTGFTQASGRALRTRLEALQQSQNPFAGGPSAAARGVLWLQPDLVAEVQFSTWTGDDMVRQASFKGMREDKKAAEVRREMPEAAGKQETVGKQEAATKPEAAVVPRKNATVKVAKTVTSPAAAKAAVRVTHPDKVVDPETGLTKQALVDYYLAVAERMLPHVVGRPLSLVRCPNGAGKACFYQKQLGQGMPAGIGGVEIPDAKGTATETYVTVLTAEGLAGLAQMNVLEVHPWGSTNADLEHPDRLVFDLDPDEAVSWTTLCGAAQEVRERLKQLSLESFVKTTGGKGLHVVAPDPGGSCLGQDQGIYPCLYAADGAG